MHSFSVLKKKKKKKKEGRELRRERERERGGGWGGEMLRMWEGEGRARETKWERD